MAGLAKNHDYHMVEPSPWPFVGSVSVLILAIGGVFWMHNWTPWVFFIGLVGVLYTMYAWWADVTKEANNGVDHTPVVQMHHRYGMMLFIASEVMFFVAWFWAYFDASLYANEAVMTARVVATGGQWPPVGIESLDPLHLPLFNTITLLLSGTTVTWAHHALLHNDRKGLLTGLALTIILGMIFSYVQYYEYAHAPFAFAGSIYGSTFFMATGFHGFHVIVGTIFLIVCLIRAALHQFTPEHHFGFEAAAWYWHFVDVVWLFLFFSIYVWGSWGAVIHAE